MAVNFTNELRAKGVRVYPLKPELKVPEQPVVKNLDSLLQDIYVRFIALRDKEFAKYYNIFDTIFHQLHEQMKKADAYYELYSSTAQFAGSHYDKLRINKPDEFDMDIIIGLPVNMNENPDNPAKSDVLIEPIAPGFVQLKMGKQFQNLPNRDDGLWQTNQIAYGWLDDDDYLLRSKFMNWFKDAVDKAMNLFEEDDQGNRFMEVDGEPYILRFVAGHDKRSIEVSVWDRKTSSELFKDQRLSASGPAVTLIVEDIFSGFRLDVDLVPAIKFPEDRFNKISNKYRRVPKQCKKEYFMVVPKPMKGNREHHEKDRSWRLAMHLQEKDLMYDSKNMKQVIRLIKKVRDSLEIDKIASYYIKTMFYHEAIEKEDDPDFWGRNSTAELFIIMIKKFLYYMEKGEIPYFWNKDFNLIGDLKPSVLNGYASKLRRLVQVLDDPSKYKKVAEFLLTGGQLKDYNKKCLLIKTQQSMANGSKRKAYLTSLYTCNLWAYYTKRAYGALRVQYNNAFRVLVGLPRFCSTSGMFAEGRIDCFYTTMRMRSTSLVRRVRASPNPMLYSIADRSDCPYMRHCEDMHISKSIYYV